MIDDLRDNLSVRSIRFVPVVVLFIAAVSWYLDANAVRHQDIFSHSDTLLVDPLYHSINMFVHFDHSHFAGNMRLLIPFGILLTWLTSNRHVLVVVAVSQFLANIVSGIAGQFVYGASGVMLALLAALLVRSTGLAMQNAAPETVQLVVGSLLSVASLLLFLIFLGSGGSGWIAHFHHFLGFTFGGAVEAVFLFAGMEAESRRSGRGRRRRVPR